MNKSPLENPIWHSLRTDHAPLAEGDDCARRYPQEIGPLAGIADSSDTSYNSLRLLAGDHPVVLFSLDPIQPPRDWTVIRTGTVVQMARMRMGSAPPLPTPDHKPIAVPPDTSTTSPTSPTSPSPTPIAPSSGRAGRSTASSDHATAAVLDAPADTLAAGVTLRQLTPADAPSMVALAELTEPGPFRLRTIELGNFYGIFHDDRLVSMAGKRMHVPGYVEVSGVCTHPDARGQGYARRLMQLVMDEIEQSGRTPFLHAWQNNPATRLYESLGFSLTRTFHLAVLKHFV
ncbi:MAG TPA: GNAT family N-acetyltransferase [Terracidiphilus sp.]